MAQLFQVANGTGFSGDKNLAHQFIFPSERRLSLPPVVEEEMQGSNRLEGAMHSDQLREITAMNLLGLAEAIPVVVVKKANWAVLQAEKKKRSLKLRPTKNSSDSSQEAEKKEGASLKRKVVTKIEGDENDQANTRDAKKTRTVKAAPANGETKTCANCNQTKPVNSFYRQGHGYHPECRNCIRGSARMRDPNYGMPADLPKGLRICAECHEAKTLDCFYFRAEEGVYRSRCKICHQKQNKRAKNKH